jgi:DNA polymerase III subunit delta
MAALKTTELQSLLKSGAEKFDAFLVHGLDAGQVAELAKSIADRLSAASSPPGDILRLSEQDLAQTPGRLAGEARSLAMFGGRPVILVKQGPQLTPALFEELFSGPPLAAYIVIEAGNLKRDAKLRQIFEKARNAAAIACYGADRSSLAQLIREEVQAAGMTITRDAAERLNQLLGGDWAVSRGEVAKLTLYAQGEKEITLEHVDAVVGDASAHAYDAAIAATLAGDPAAALAHLEGLVGAGTPASVFLTLLGGHLQKLHAVLAALDRGESFDGAVAKLRPPLHFRQKDAMRAQTGRWRLPEVAAAIAAAQETLRQTRLKPALEDALAATLILRLCRARKQPAA